MVRETDLLPNRVFTFFTLRPIKGEERLRPDELRDYRKTHEFLGPCCLCPMKDSKLCFAEAAIHMPVIGRYAGEYVAECSKSQCGYLGLLFFLIVVKKKECSHTSTA